MSNEWYTPEGVSQAVREVMGGIDLDPASCPLANRVVRAERIITKEENGLIQPWRGRVYLNPPFSKDENGRSNIHKWVTCLLAHIERGDIEECILLTPMSLATDWYARLWDYLICVPTKRVHFWREGEGESRPMFSSSFMYYGPHGDRFIEVFRRFGRIARAVDAPKAPTLLPGLWTEAQPESKDMEPCRDF